MNLQFDALEKQIRYGYQPDNHCLLVTFVNLTLERVRDENSASKRLQLLEKSLYVLLETVCDTLVAVHWRRSCYDAMFQPLIQLERFSITEKDKYRARQVQREINTLSQYFLSPRKNDFSV